MWHACAISIRAGRAQLCGATAVQFHVELAYYLGVQAQRCAVCDFFLLVQIYPRVIAGSELFLYIWIAFFSTLLGWLSVFVRVASSVRYPVWHADAYKPRRITSRVSI